jgi:HlyD family secretion protein
VVADVDETDVVHLRLDQRAKITVDALPDTSFPGAVVEIASTARRAVSAVEGQTNFEVKVVFESAVPAIRPGMTADVEIETATRSGALGVPIQAVVVRTARDLEAQGRRSRRGPGAAEAVTAGADSAEAAKDREITGVFVNREGVAAFVPVRTGLASETVIEIVGEVAEGDRVVSGPYRALRELKPGTKLKVSDARARS